MVFLEAYVDVKLSVDDNSDEEDDIKVTVRYQTPSAVGRANITLVQIYRRHGQAPGNQARAEMNDLRYLNE